MWGVAVGLTERRRVLPEGEYTPSLHVALSRTA